MIKYALFIFMEGIDIDFVNRYFFRKVSYICFVWIHLICSMVLHSLKC